MAIKCPRCLSAETVEREIVSAPGKKVRYGPAFCDGCGWFEPMDHEKWKEKDDGDQRSG